MSQPIKAEEHMLSQGNLQDAFLNSIRKESIGVVVNLMDGNQMRGTVKSFDNFTILIESGGKRQLIYKHGITCILPAKDPAELQLNVNHKQQQSSE